MRKINANLIKLAFICTGSGLGIAAYAQSPQQMEYFCQTHQSSEAQQSCAQYFQQYNVDEDDYGYYPSYYNYPYFVPNVIIQNNDQDDEFHPDHGEDMGHFEGGMPDHGDDMDGMHMGGGEGMHMGGGGHR